MMRTIIQITAEIPNFTSEVWYDLMEVENINDLASLRETAARDFPARKVRVVQILETGDADG